MAKTEKPHISISITTESLTHSILKDVSRVLVFGGPIALNAMTIQSTLFNFVIGLALVLYLAAMIYRPNRRIVRGTSAEDVIRQLRERIALIERGQE